MNIFQYFRKKGINTLPSSFYGKIAEWESWYNGNVKRFTFYRVYTGRGCYSRCKRHSLGMAKKVCEDMADLLLNERVTIVLDDQRTDAFVRQILQDNHFDTLGNEYQERKACSGTVAYVPCIEDLQSGLLGEVTGGRIKINYVTAKNIFPVSWENGKIQEVIFAFPKTYCTKRYLHLQHHKVGGDGNYRIENTVLLVTAGSTCGQEHTEEEWQEVPIFAGLPEEIETGSAEPQFVIDRLNMVNNADMEDEENPMGISLFANSIDILRKIDTEYDSYANEFGLGRKRIFVAPEMLTDENGNKVFDENDTVFYSLPEETLKDTNPIYEVNMELRTEQHSKALNDDLNYLSMKCGFGTERYKFEKGTVATATQVISENSDMYRSLCKHEIVLQSALEELIRIIIRLGITLGEPLKEDVEVTINFDDSIIEDKEAERQRDRQDVSMGAMGVDEYRAKWFGETLEQARKNLPVQNNVME